MYQKPIPEVLTMANAIEDQEERAKFLTKHMRDAVSKVLACFFNENIEFEKFKNIEFINKHNKPGVSDSTLDHEVKRLYIFTKQNPVPLERKHQKLIQVLESMCTEDSNLVLDIIKKKNPYKNINKNFIKKYFPSVLTKSISRM